MYKADDGVLFNSSKGQIKLSYQYDLHGRGFRRANLNVYVAMFLSRF